MSSPSGGRTGEHAHANVLVALSGQPNVGKSTVFNMLTGARQHVANFPGVTVEKRQGGYKNGDIQAEVVDLPGTYSLSSYSQDERVTRDFILLERPEVVVNILDASNLERNLLLTFQLREMGVPLVVCLNMMDVAGRRGMRIDTERLSEALGVPVVPVVGRTGEGRDALRAAIREVCHRHEHAAEAWTLDYGPELEPVLRELTGALAARPHLMEDFPARWLAIKLAEGDTEARRILQHHTHDGAGVDLADRADRSLEELTRRTGLEPDRVIADQRYRAAAEMVRACVERARGDGRTLSDRIDRWLLHPVVGPLVLFVTLFLFYEVVMVGGTWLAEEFLALLDHVHQAIGALFPSPGLLRGGLVRSLVVDGLAGGLIALFEYIPIFFILFALIAILEDTGYMARIAFILDRLMRRFGLHGQSTLPMLLGGAIVGGCCVPGVAATRAIRDEKARFVTVLIMPLMNCVAKIPFYILIVGLFFSHFQGLVLYGVSIFSLLTALLAARLFSRVLVRGETAPFILEFPPYRAPTPAGILRPTVERLWHFFSKVVAVIAPVLVVVWFLVTFPGLGTEREAAWDERIDAAAAEMRRVVPAESPYGRALEAKRLAPLARAWSRLAEAQAPEGETAAAYGWARELDEAERRLVRAAVVGPDAGATDDLRRAASAFDRFAATARELRLERKREVIATSYAGRVGKALAPLTERAGFNWRLNIAILSSFAAKESLVGTLGTLYSVEEGDVGGLTRRLHEAEPDWTRWNALAILIFVALFPPCMPTLIAIRNETGSFGWMLFAAVYPIVLGFVLAVLVFQAGTALG
jgi:ferrous iron transport protein B